MPITAVFETHFFFRLCQPIVYVFRHDHDNQNTRHENVFDPEIIVIFDSERINNSPFFNNTPRTAFELQFNSRRKESSRVSARGNAAIDAIVVNIWLVKRITRHGRHGVNVGSTELFFALVNVHCRIVYEVVVIGAREIEPNKRLFGGQKLWGFYKWRYPNDL
jgi:hypothetical protein